MAHSILSFYSNYCVLEENTIYRPDMIRD